MWKERAPRRYTILWFWSQFFECVDINLASFAHVLHFSRLREYIYEYVDGGRVKLMRHSYLLVTTKW